MRDRSGAMRRRGALALALCCLLGFLLSGCARVLPQAGVPQVREDAVRVEVLPGRPDFSGVRDGAPHIACGARDRLGRATAAFALLGRESLTDRDRPDMSQLYPTGMHNAPYDFIRDRWVYNRCHLIGRQFGGASALDNLITGTHALNHTYMLPWENRVADYIRKTGRHVMYRVTPEYDGDELVCRAVRIDALSCDWRGTLCFSVRCPNVQPGVAIDYATGHTTLADDWAQGGTDAAPRTYVINRKNGRFHLPACEDAAAISRRNRLERFCARGELLGEGRAPCGKCRP